ncbi:MAG: TonB-dependent receptor domain-containing protein [Terriglobia bacterium]
MNRIRHILKRPCHRTVLLAGCLFLAAGAAYGQFTSGFTGTVSDPSSRVIPNAKVMVTNQATNVARQTVSTDTGAFRVSSLPQGIYRIEVTAPGFKPWVQTEVRLNASEVVTVYPVLPLAQQTTVVEVKSALAAVEIDKADTSRQLGQTTIQDAPLLGRNVYTSMIELAPGVTGSGLPSGGATGSGSNNNDSFEQEPAYQINASGQRQEDNEYSVDGSSVDSASRGGVVNLTPEPDFVQSMQVSGVTFSASKGQTSGAFIQLFTKPGTNQVHGSLSEFHTDNDLSSRTIFQQSVPAFTRNEFGGSLGGPIIKNRLFAFGGLFFLRSDNVQSGLATVETPQFAQFVENTFPNNISSVFFKDAPPGAAPTQNILTVGQLEQLTPGSYPAPMFPANLPAVGTVAVNLAIPHNAYQWHARVDYNFNQYKDRLFFDWFRTWDDTDQYDPRPIYRVTLPNGGIYGKADWTHTFSPTILNDVSFTGNRAAGSNPGTQNYKQLPDVNITGISGFNQWGAAGWVHDNYNWHDMLTWTHGSHTIETGIDVDRHHDDDNFNAPLLRPTFGFSNLMDFAQDRPFSQSGPAVTVATKALASDLYQVIRTFETGAYVQDDWKVTPHFTLNLGLRYTYFGHLGAQHNTTTPFPLFTPGAGSDFAAQVADGTMSVRGGKASYMTNNALSGWGPRAGFGWDIFGNGKTSLRGGYGVYYNTIADGSFSFAVRNPPPTWASPSFNIFENQVFSYGLGNSTGQIWPLPPGLSFSLNPAGGLAGIPVESYGVSPVLDPPLTQVWMLSLQHELGNGLMVEADYNASHSSRLFVQTDVNRFPGDLVANGGTLTRLNPNFGPIIFGRTIGVADGEYGSLMARKDFTRSWSLTGIFSYGKSTDDLSSDDNGTGSSESVIDSLNVNGQHGLSDFDVAKRFTVDSVVLIPVPWKSGLLNRALGGWRMSNIVVLQSGLPYTVYTSASYPTGDFNADGYNYDTPDAPSFGNNISTNRSDFIKGVFPASAFTSPAPGTEGNLGRNTFIGPGLANVNTELAKGFKIPWFTREGATFEIRADFFNLFNRVNLTQPVSDLSSSLFGQSTSQNLPRATQVGIHIDF